MRSILNQHIVNSPTEQSTATGSVAFRTIQQQLEFHIQIIQNLGARSKANEERLRNEINLVVLLCSSYLQYWMLINRQSFNVVAQGENRMTTQLAKSSERHSAAMRTVSVVTITFLPATFVSVSGPRPAMCFV